MDEIDLDDLDGINLDEIVGELTDEDKTAINAETDELVAFVAENGVNVETVTDDGIRYVDLADDTPESTWQLVDQFYADEYGESEAPSEPAVG